MAYVVTEKSTVNGFGTPHGYNTPHRFPTAGEENLSFTFANLSAQLYPTGRAFYMPKDGVMDNVHIAINRSFIRLINDCKSTIDSVFPDNENFNEEDCNLWEYRFGLRTNPSTSIKFRRDAILRKMGRGRNVPARQHKDYIEYQLQTAGFNVYVYENGFQEGNDFVYKTPEQITEANSNIVQHGNDFQHGLGSQHGAGGSQIIANSAKPNESFSVGENNQWATFFIGGETLGSFASVPANRQEEFRELVLKLKPMHLVAYTFINFV